MRQGLVLLFLAKFAICGESENVCQKEKGCLSEKQKKSLERYDNLRKRIERIRLACGEVRGEKCIVGII